MRISQNRGLLFGRFSRKTSRTLPTWRGPKFEKHPGTTRLVANSDSCTARHCGRANPYTRHSVWTLRYLAQPATWDQLDCSGVVAALWLMDFTSSQGMSFKQPQSASRTDHHLPSLDVTEAKPLVPGANNCRHAEEMPKPFPSSANSCVGLHKATGLRNHSFGKKD